MSDENSGMASDNDPSLQDEEVKVVYMTPNTEYFGFDEHPFINAFVFTICGILIAIMVGLLITYFVCERLRAKESRDEEQRLEEKYKQEAQEILQKSSQAAQPSVISLSEMHQNASQLDDEENTNTTGMMLLEPSAAQELTKQYVSVEHVTPAQTELALLKPKDALQSERVHRRKRSRYYEAEVHTSEATVEEEDLPSRRLTNSVSLMDAVGRKSMHGYKQRAADGGQQQFEMSPAQKQGGKSLLIPDVGNSSTNPFTPVVNQSIQSFKHQEASEPVSLASSMKVPAKDYVGIVEEHNRV